MKEKQKGGDKVGGGLMIGRDGESGDQKRRKGEEPPLDDISVTQGKVKILAAEGRVGMDGEAAGPGGQRSGRVRGK